MSLLCRRRFCFTGRKALQFWLVTVPVHWEVRNFLLRINALRYTSNELSLQKCSTWRGRVSKPREDCMVWLSCFTYWNYQGVYKYIPFHLYSICLKYTLVCQCLGLTWVGSWAPYRCSLMPHLQQNRGRKYDERKGWYKDREITHLPPQTKQTWHKGN